jgi:hypothetical protein
MFVTYLLDKAKQELNDSTEALLFHVSTSTEQTEHVNKVIVNGVILGAELSEEHSRKIRDSAILILKTLGHLTQLTLNLDLSGKNQESQGHETCSLDGRVVIRQSTVQEVGVLVNEVIKANSHISKGNDSVASDRRVGRSLHDGDKQR